jgi:hypothetical protein
MEHLYGIRPACSSREDELMKKRLEAFRDPKGPETFKAIGERERDVVRDSFSEEKARALFARFRKNETWQCPTLTVLRSISWLDDPKFTNDPRMKYAPAWVREFWDPKNDFRFKSTTPADYARMKRDFQGDLELVAAMKAAGVGFLAGTDEANPYCFPGFSLHDELALLVKAGLTPLQALQAATINSARYLGKEPSQGTIEVGKDADLVLLDADPLTDIRNTTKVRAVVSDGRLYDRTVLDRILDRVAAEHGGAKPSTSHATPSP